MVLQNHYSIVAGSLSGLHPSSVSLPRVAEDLLVAHLIYKCLVKVACWVWPRTQTKDAAAYALAPWVSSPIMRYWRCSEPLYSLWSSL